MRIEESDTDFLQSGKPFHQQWHHAEAVLEGRGLSEFSWQR